MSSAPAPIVVPGPVGFVLPGGFDLSIDLDFLTGWCDCLKPLSQEIQRVIQEYRAMGQGTEGPALWLVDYREDLRILFFTALDGVPELQTDLAARVRAKFRDYDAWRRGLAPAPE
ncbi:uncharacterized protein BHQ10_007528 [Talaromyces amestolkiae]|uniref:Uncharacterized protein n=1 Tax=Talaromyces amestolkiae TaxID=1196081 RepID=A0A364L6T9_TALAM|nr:uncharacterized protein BHQ10_007528 [Talaromyces amestolkiae]RAO71516.1 hypothetical protein BHQ10_007528 [Talaromyces amestolkiae]